MVRDYSSETYVRLTETIFEIDTTETNWLTDKIGDLWITFKKWLGILSIEDYKNNIDEYHRYVLDQHNTMISELSKIFEAVSDVDTDYAGSVRKLNDDAESMNSIIEQLAERLSCGLSFASPDIKSFITEARNDITSAAAAVNKDYTAQYKIRKKGVAGEAGLELAKDIVTVAVVILTAPVTASSPVKVATTVWDCFNRGIAIGNDLRSLGMLVFDANSDTPWEQIADVEEADRVNDLESSAEYWDDLYESYGYNWLHVMSQGSETLDVAAGIVGMADTIGGMGDSITDLVEGNTSWYSVLGFTDPNSGVDELVNPKSAEEWGKSVEFVERFKKYSGVDMNPGDAKRMANYGKNVKTVIKYADEAVKMLQGKDGNPLNVVFGNNDLVNNIVKDGIFKVLDYFDDVLPGSPAQPANP